MGGSSAIGVDTVVPGRNGTEKWMSPWTAIDFRRGEEGAEGVDGKTRVNGPSGVSRSCSDVPTRHVLLDVFVAPQPAVMPQHDR